MLTVLAFLAALALLIAVHEYGHYRAAVACGVKVLRFSVGFGKVVWSWTPKGSPTEFAVSLFPLGGYVKMLDEREAPVPADERHLAFNTQPLRSRAFIVAAGPLANLLLATLLYAAVNWSGVEEARAVLASPVAGSLAEKAGLVGGEVVLRAANGDDSLDDVRSFDDLRWRLTRGALDGENVRLEVTRPGASGSAAPAREVVLPLSGLQSPEPDAALFRRIGILSPWTKPLVGNLVADGAAARDGLQPGDEVLQVGATRIVDGQQLRETVRASVSGEQALTQTWSVLRAGVQKQLQVTPDVQKQDGQAYGRIGAFVGAPPEMVTVDYGLFEGLWNGAVRTWDISLLTLRMMGKMLIGEASLKNLSGPLTIADYAGKSAQMGLSQYLTFLALISVSLGVLNLLPLPVLDGGHLMYYLWEAVTGKGVSDAWMERLQRGGVAVLLVMMSIAFFNDVTRIFG
ncbi:RIP metalloprotease RseP [Variovorax sp. HJSM1_2]|uniref:RIP metalloprotease RseP n=1 Tax=Variovorax sp. HJSM1_2 TaxID=3366263 RepID=UPI003BE0BF7A